MESQTPDHHVRQELCTTRPPYRQGRKLTAVKVYTINSESPHLHIYGVPQLKLRNELRSLCVKYGRVLKCYSVPNATCEQFTECYHVQYDRIQSARIAKRLLDDKAFYGGVLHACYAPEKESIVETRAKLMQRCKDVAKRAPSGSGGKELVEYESYAKMTRSQLRKKRKYPDEVDASNKKQAVK